MDDNDKAVTEEVTEQSEENTQIESPTIEQTTEEVDSSEEVQTQTEDTQTVEAPKKGAQSRIKELVRERDAEREKSQSLAQKLEELIGGVSPEIVESQAPQYEPGTEVTPEQYQQDLNKTADSIVSLRIRQSEATNRIRNESLDAVRKYPELDPDSPNFNKELSDSITEATEALVRSNPYSASVSKFVDKLMKPYKGAVSTEVGKATENIAKQVSQTALRPTNVSKPEKTASEKSIEELEQELGIVIT